MLTVSGLGVRYGDATAVSAVDLTVGPTEFVAVLGSNGAGKSSAGKAIAGLVPATGEVSFHGESLAGRSAEKRVRAGIVYVPEGRRVFTQASVEDNLRAGGFVRRRSHDWKQRLAEIYRRLPRLEERAHVKAELLSGGEQQLLAISRGLMARPRLMILDEPSLGLSPRAIETVIEFLTEVAAAEELSVLILEQNVSFASRLAERAVVLRLGRITGELDAEQVRDPEQVLRMLMATETAR